MSFKLAVTGKSGSGKTTVAKAFLRIFQENFPDKCGKHEYKTGIPEGMSKQEFVEWAMEDIVVSLDENVDIIVSWFVGSKDCRCPITGQINDAVLKLIDRYDIVIFDCEFDLKYLNQLVDTDIDTTLIIANPTDESAHLAKRIEEFSAKYAAGNQLGVIINNAANSDLTNVYELLKRYDLDVLGVIPTYKELETKKMEKESKVVQEAIKQFYFRLNLPQNRE